MGIVGIVVAVVVEMGNEVSQNDARIGSCFKSKFVCVFVFCYVCVCLCLCLCLCLFVFLFLCCAGEEFSHE